MRRFGLICIALATSQCADTGALRMPRPVGGPLVLQEDWPVFESPTEAEGTTRFTLDVGPNGRVTGCTIDQSSGWHRLDRAACRAATKRGRFEPARDARGRPVAGKWTSSVVWQIPE